MKAKFPRVMRFGLGFGLVPVHWRPALKDSRSGQYNPGSAAGTANASHSIEMSATEPVWEQVSTYGHEVLHAAIDFDRYCQRLARELLQEAMVTKQELTDE